MLHNKGHLLHGVFPLLLLFFQLIVIPLHAQTIPENTNEEIKNFIERKHQQKRDSILNSTPKLEELKEKKTALEEKEQKARGAIDTLKNAFTLPGQQNGEEDAAGLQNDFQDSLRQLQKLPLLQGAKLKDSIYVKVLDAKDKHLPQKDYKIKESQINEVYKEVMIKEKTSFKDRAYLEGLVGFNDLDFDLLQVAPAMGFQLNKGFSLGLGLDGFFKRGVPDLGTSKEMIVGLKSFVKWEAWKDKFYLQAENSSYFSDVSYLTENLESKKESLQVPYVGGGYLLNISDNKQLNVSLMHRLREHPFFTEGDSSWLLRLGLSIYPYPMK